VGTGLTYHLAAVDPLPGATEEVSYVVLAEYVVNRLRAKRTAMNGEYFLST
jgi:hypothetical protein